MKYYLDITLLANADIAIGFLWQKVYQQMHLALAESKNNNHGALAFSFPEYKKQRFPLGSKLRVLAETEEELKKFDVKRWLERLTDYTHATSIKMVPKSVEGFARFTRFNIDSNIEYMARRRAKRKGETLEEALVHYKGYQAKETRLPFVRVKSITSNTQFPLFIRQELFKNNREGEYTCYGLSQAGGATVPVFN